MTLPQPDPEKEALKATVIRLREAATYAANSVATDPSKCSNSFFADESRRVRERLNAALSETTPTLREAEAKEALIAEVEAYMNPTVERMSSREGLRQKLFALQQARQPSKESAQEG